MIGLARGTVEVVLYTPDWSILFQQEQVLLREALGELALDIQHIGSTAIPGLASKPIIDIGIAVADLTLVSQCIAPLTSAPIRGRRERGQLFENDEPPIVSESTTSPRSRLSAGWDC